jgi:hypothetical protein
MTSFVELNSTELATQSLLNIANIIHHLTGPNSAEVKRELGTWYAAQANKSCIRLDFHIHRLSFLTAGWHISLLYTVADLDAAPTLASAVFMSDMVHGMVYFLQSARKNRVLGSIIFLNPLPRRLSKTAKNLPRLVNLPTKVCASLQHVQLCRLSPTSP